MLKRCYYYYIIRDTEHISVFVIGMISSIIHDFANKYNCVTSLTGFREHALTLYS